MCFEECKYSKGGTSNEKKVSPGIKLAECSVSKFRTPFLELTLATIPRSNKKLIDSKMGNAIFNVDLNATENGDTLTMLAALLTYRN